MSRSGRPTSSVGPCGPALWLSLLFAAACRETAPPPNALAASAGVRRVLLVTIDTLRADHLGCYGRAEAETPHLDRLAAGGMRFDRAYSPCPLTLPSHASLLTGTQPPEHGLRDNGFGALPGELATLAEVFRREGYRTGAVVGAAVLDSAFGLDRGFETYDDGDGAQAGSGHVFVRSATDVTDRALAWLDRPGDEPFFLWVHYYDPHSAYEPPAPFRERHAHPYDGEIAYVDSQLARLVARLEARGWLQDTLVVVTSDHGEALGEHGERTHGVTIYEATQRVPLIVSLSAGIAGGRASDLPVQLADVLPTIMELFDLSLPGTATGRSFAAVLAGGRLEPGPVYAENEYSRLNFGWSAVRSLRVGDWKYVRSSAPELYRLDGDPGEREDLAAREPQRAAALRAELERYERSLVRRDAARAATDPELDRALLALGYSIGRAAGDEREHDPFEGRSPRDGVGLLNRYHEAGSLAKLGRHREVVELMEPVVASSPDAAAFHLVLGASLREIDRLEDSRRSLAEAVRLDPRFEPAHYELGVTLARAGELGKAREHFEISTRLNPVNHLSHLNAAVLAADAGDGEAAARHYEALVGLRPGDARFRVNFAYVLRAMDLNVEMRRQLEEAHRLAPEDAGLTAYLAWELATNPDASVRDGGRALRLARSVCKADSLDADRLDTLAAAQAEAGHFAEAVRTAERALELARSEIRQDLAAAIGRRLARYRSGEAWRE